MNKPWLELWLDKINHIMEALRTLFNLLNLGIGLIILLRVFGVI